MMIIRKALLHLVKRQRCFGLPSSDLVRPGNQDYRMLAKAVEQALVDHDISVWFPRCIDTINGGFTAGYSNTWQTLAAQSKGLVFHARMTWFTAQLSERMSGDAARRFQDYALHGVKFLQQTLWDSKRGGFFWNLNNDGSLPPGDPDEKYVYGVAFAIFGCANVARVTHDDEAFELAQRTFRWLDAHAHDPSNGGYYETLSGDGTPLVDALSKPALTPIGLPYGYKSMNTHIHLLEAFTELYRVWPDPILRGRLEELFHLVRDKMFVRPGCLNKYYTADFQPVPALGSYGHDVETAYLLVEAAGVLGIPDDECTWKKGRHLVDNALQYAFDGKLGGFFDEGPAFHNATHLDKVWWTQAEALNALLVMHERSGADDLRYWAAFMQTWRFIGQYQFDSKNGGWHETVWEDDKPILANKGHNWKAAYHTGRALLNVSARLRRLGQETPPEIKP
jgi:mannobiose 2-epimerase